MGEEEVRVREGGREKEGRERERGREGGRDGRGGRDKEKAREREGSEEREEGKGKRDGKTVRYSRESSIHGIVHERLIAHAIRYRSVPFVGNGMKWNRTGNIF